MGARLLDAEALEEEEYVDADEELDGRRESGMGWYSSGSATWGVAPSMAPSLRVDRTRWVRCLVSRTFDVWGGAVYRLAYA